MFNPPYRPVSVQFPPQRTSASVRPPGLGRSKTAMADAEDFAIAEHIINSATCSFNPVEMCS